MTWSGCGPLANPVTDHIEVLTEAIRNGTTAWLWQSSSNSVTRFTLPNGLTFLVIERHDAPVVSFHTYVDVGSVDDPTGRTGLAHMFEHMAFKGTPTIGTKDWAQEKKALDQIEIGRVGLAVDGLHPGRIVDMGDGRDAGEDRVKLLAHSFWLTASGFWPDLPRCKET